MAAHLHVKRGDIVEVITGNHKGATGKILQVITAKQRVLIEGVRMIKKHTRRSQDNPQGAIVDREGPIHISNVRIAEIAEKSKPAEKAKSAEKPKAEKPKAEKPKAEKTKSAPKSKKKSA
ncbi:MAG: 50S ribosomal protein L24 [Chthoniobacteraceae bacterium]|jgi:large subunit ribosomal protein L24